MQDKLNQFQVLNDFFYYRPLKSSDISLMDDNQNEWGEEESSDTKRFRVS